MIKRMMDGGMLSIAARAGIGVGLLLVAGQAGAQQVIQQVPPQTYPAQPYPGQVQQPVYAQPQQPVYAQPQVAPQAVVVQTAPAAGAAPAGTDDQKMWVGHLGIGWLGTLPIPFGASTGGPSGNAQTPMVGFRYWAAPAIGFDAGIGFFTQGGSAPDPTNPGSNQDTATTTSFALHAGLPLVLGSTQHLSVQLIPELNLGFASRTSKVGTTDVTESGLHVNVGARAGAELYFGFIGVPALALEGSVGLFLSALSQKTEAGGESVKASQLIISTSSIQQPWDIFRSDVAARYYF